MTFLSKNPFDWGPGCHLKPFKFEAGPLSFHYYWLGAEKFAPTFKPSRCFLKNGNIEGIDFSFQLSLKKPF